MQNSHAWAATTTLFGRGGGPYVAAHRKGRPLPDGGRPGVLEMEGPMTSLKTIAEKLNAWRRYREAVRELSQMSDRELQDIGIRRGDIEFVVRRSVNSAA